MLYVFRILQRETNKRRRWRISPWSFNKFSQAWIWRAAFQPCSKCCGILWILALTLKTGLPATETKNLQSRDVSGRVLMSIVHRFSKPTQQIVECVVPLMPWKQRKSTEIRSLQEVLTHFKNKTFLIPSNILHHCRLVLKQEKSLLQKQVILSFQIQRKLWSCLFRKE